MNVDYKEQEIYVKIPNYRIGALIGKNGVDKKELEELTNAKIEIGSDSGEITIVRNKADAFTFYRLEHVVKAIGRGFSPAHAKLLLEESYFLDIIDLKEFGLSSDKQMQTKRGRVIGAKGTMRKFIEDALECYISIQGKTVSIIGKIPYVGFAKEAIASLLSGSNISSVKKQIQRKMKNKESGFETDDSW